MWTVRNDKYCPSYYKKPNTQNFTLNEQNLHKHERPFEMRRQNRQGTSLHGFIITPEFTALEG